MLKSYRFKNDSGFTLFEVLVSILVASTFVAAGLQSIVLAAYFQVRSKEVAEATAWIQEDLETVKEEARLISLPYDIGTCTNPTQITGYADKLRDRISGASSATATTNTVTRFLKAANRDGKPGRLPHKLQRVVTLSSTLPHVLGISYQVIDEEPDPDRVLAQLNTEVIPDAALQCP